MTGARPLFRSDQAYQTAMADYERALAQMRTPYECRYVATRHGFTHVLMSGVEGAPSVVLWHGMNVNLTMWCDLIDQLADRYRVYAVDTIGNQGRSAPNRPSKHTAAHSEWALDVLDGLGIERTHCVGFSQGGWIIVRLAEQAASRITSATLLSCAGLVPVHYRLLLRMAPALLFPSPEARARTVIRLMSAPNHQPSVYEVRVFMNMQHYAIEGRIPLLRDEQLRTLACPVQLIMGNYDRTFNARRAVARFCAVLPHGEALLLDALSHGLEEDRALVYRHICTFLERHTSV